MLLVCVRTVSKPTCSIAAISAFERPLRSSSSTSTSHGVSGAADGSSGRSPPPAGGAAVDRVEQLTAAGALGQAGARAGADQLPALGRRRMIGQHHEPRPREGRPRGSAARRRSRASRRSGSRRRRRVAAIVVDRCSWSTSAATTDSSSYSLNSACRPWLTMSSNSPRRSLTGSGLIVVMRVPFANRRRGRVRDVGAYTRPRFNSHSYEEKVSSAEETAAHTPTPRGPEFGASRTRQHRSVAAHAAATTEVDQSITDVGRTTCLFIPSSLGDSPSASPTSWGRCSTGSPSSRPTDLGRRRLLEVEVEVAQRARDDQAVGLGVDRVAEVPAGLLQRRLLVHRDDRKAAALVDAGVVDHGAAERLDHHVQVAVARVLLVDPQPLHRAHDVAAVERPDA